MESVLWWHAPRRGSSNSSDVLTPAVDSVRLFLHVLAATVWVGGQLTLAGLVPGLRALGADVPSTVARRFGRIAWPAFALLVATGIWNVVAVNPSRQSGQWRATLWIKLAVVVVSGLSAWLHGRARSRSGLAAWGAVSGLTAMAALLLGVLLEG